MRTLAATLVACLSLTSIASADRFYVGSEAAAAKMEQGASYIEGVLLRTEGDDYVIRVEGGEITLAKALVYKVEKDGLTVADLEKREQARAQNLVDANLRRQQVQAAEASVTRERVEQRRAEEPDRSLTVVIDFQGLLPGYSFKTYDPVLHRADLGGLRTLIEDYLRDEVLRAAHREP